ncbi:shikimate dehydrogenase [Buchnera aphidicola (Mollitrichosiphum nigrofasciatum)]|uniref:shikimate dehydrogenase n=1 Tax=Buchnera aphidicola TaxID=9 RepID=UPI0031B7F756
MNKFSCVEGIFGVFGNPIFHSKSPYIHDFFSKKTNIKHIYRSYCIPLNNFDESMNDFFKNKGKGANITTPFKNKAFFFADIVSEEAQISRSVNTLLKLRNGLIYGDNTDGKGLLYDLKRLNFIHKDNNILIIGAGGAVYGIILSLFRFNCTVYIYNRTKSKALKIIKLFKKFGNIFFLNINNFELIHFNLIIHATSLGILGKYPKLPVKIVRKKTPCYDLFYSSKQTTPFLSWYSNNGGSSISDGIGMLIAQAAYSFKLWHGIKPNINYTINKLKI